MDEMLRLRLRGMIERVTRKRHELQGQGTMFLGYNEELKEVHNSNARDLAEIVDDGGWPDVPRAGEEGAAAAFMIVQQSIGLPRFMTACLEMMEEAANAGRIPKWQVALLTDRICMLEGRPQVYGTQFDWDEKGELNPIPIEDPDNVDARRRAVDLIPMADAIVHERREVAARGERAPHDGPARQADFDAWARAVGWRL